MSNSDNPVKPDDASQSAGSPVDWPAGARKGSPFASAWYGASRSPESDGHPPPVPEVSPQMRSLHMSSLRRKMDWNVDADTETYTEQELLIPAFKLHPLDMYLIREAADKMNLSVVDYVQIAPFLYAKFMRDVGW